MRIFFLIFWITVYCNIQLSASECKKAGIAMTFDDTFIDQWYAARYLFIKYNAKATYFISRPYNINEVGYKKLRKLQDDGHEIGSHTIHHSGIRNHYNNDPSLVEQYLDEEIIPSIRILESHGLKISSFAHPYGQYTEAYNKMLLQNFLFIRATTYTSNNQSVATLDNAFYSRSNDDRLLHAVGIDNKYNNSLESLQDAMIRAKNNSEVLVLYAHAIEVGEGLYRTPPERIEAILNFASEIGLEFYTISELRTLCN